MSVRACCCFSFDLSPRDDYNLIKCKQFFPRRVEFCHWPHCMWSHTRHHTTNAPSNGREQTVAKCTARCVMYENTCYSTSSYAGRLQMAEIAFLHRKSSIIESYATHLHKSHTEPQQRLSCLITIKWTARMLWIYGRNLNGASCDGPSPFCLFTFFVHFQIIIYIALDSFFSIGASHSLFF